ncbi:unnamed protein product [Hyaloperonospora brassicae]|uniref:RxLR effector protein n=1 Tax=Hyaloperonospora brassicae TaxID=162125 RepID=A0AAV0TMG5_HYABA|nr:unnamed protein product [Hyaloperonospora brassicae]
MRPLNIAVYLVAAIHAMDVGPQLAAAVVQHESISSRAAAVESQVSGAQTVHPSESRLLRGEASASEQAGVGLDVGPLTSEPMKIDQEVVNFIKGRLKLNGDVDMDSIARAKAKPEDFVTAVGLPQNALKDRFDRMKKFEKLMFFVKLLFSRNVDKRLKLLRKFEDAHRKQVATSNGMGRSPGPIL